MRAVVWIAVVGVVAASPPHRAGAADPTPAEVFEKRIVPIFKSPNPSSCVQCHLAGVDLKDCILPDAEKTFRSLRDQGLIDLTDQSSRRSSRSSTRAAGQRRGMAESRRYLRAST